MATIFNVDLVQYWCSCQQWLPLCSEYFCRHCSVLRCGSCLCHEVDSIYCPNCLENMPSAEARLKKNRCGNCFDCPSCGHSLSTRATSAPGQPAIAPVSGDEKTPAGAPPPRNKVFYLACSFCRWTSRDAAIPDQTVATGSWPEQQNSDAKLLASILEHFRGMALVEKAERERKRYTSKRKTLSAWPDKYGIGAIITKKRLGMAEVTSAKDAVKDFTFVEASEDVEELPDAVFSDPLKLSEITTVFQRHSLPEYQPSLVNQLYPVRKQLIIKQSQRCKTCDHNVCKAEFSPNSIKFKIQLFAFLHVPEFRILHPMNLVANKKTELQLTVCNNSATLTHVVMLPDVEAMEEPFVEAEIPVSEIVLPVRDDSAVLDDKTTSIYKDDPEVIIFRNNHKVGIRMEITPPETTKNVMLQFNVKYDYVNTVYHLTGEQKEPEIVWLQQKVRINLGKLGKGDAADK